MMHVRLLKLTVETNKYSNRRFKRNATVTFGLISLQAILLITQYFIRFKVKFSLQQMPNIIIAKRFHFYDLTYIQKRLLIVSTAVKRPTYER